MIELGLARIGRLLQHTSTPWRAIHVAGTNGKGSITSYISALLSHGQVRCGRFNSPHLIDRWDCITINDRTVSESLFRKIETQVRLRNEEEKIGATEFELLTATAFEIFTHEEVEIGVVEVGLGGRLDATNILDNVIVSVIAKIGLDHQALLGDTLEAIAGEKAGIMRPNTPCVYDSTNEPSVQEIFERKAAETNTPLIPVSPTVPPIPELTSIASNLDLEPHQTINLFSALEALKQAAPSLPAHFSLLSTLPHIPKISYPGRLQRLHITPLIPTRKTPILLDGAHNTQSAHALSTHINRTLRHISTNQSQKVTYLISLSGNKPAAPILSELLRPGDNVVGVEFGPVDGMPWVSPVSSEVIAREAKSIVGDEGETRSLGADVAAAVGVAGRLAGEEGPLVVCGSLYLVSDVLRLVRVGEEQVGGEK